MFATKRIRLAVAALAVTVAASGTAAALAASASASPKPAAQASAHHARVSLNRFDLNGYVINAKYTLGRNTGNTFQQTYKHTTVQGVPIAGPYVGTVFPPVDYVALPIGNHQLYIAWLDPKTFAIVDVFVMNFAAHTVYDYAPGSAHPESAGTITVVKCGKEPLP